MPFASISGGRLYYELEGPVGAPVLLFSNSLGTNLEMWRPQVPVLSRNFRLLRYDTRGHGQSSASHGAYTAEQLANDVLLMLDQFGIAQVSFCGLSMGGMIGMSLASRAPERLTKLILCSTALRIGTAESWNQRISTVQHQGMEAIADAVLGRWFSPEFLDAQPEQVELTRKMLLQTSPEGYAACCAAVRDSDQRVAIRQLQLPTLVVCGTGDSVTTPADAREMVASIPGAQYLEFPGAHLFNIESAPEFTAALAKFL